MLAADNALNLLEAIALVVLFLIILKVLASQRRSALQRADLLARFEHIVAATSDMLLFLDLDCRYQAVNPHYLSLIGKSRAEVIGKTVEQVLGSEYFARAVRPNVERCLRGEDVRFQTWADIFADGRPRYLDVYYNPYRQADGSIVGVVGSIRDITELRQTEDALRASEARFRDFAETAADWFWELDRELRFSFLSGRYQETLGIGVDQIIGRSREELSLELFVEGSEMESFFTGPQRKQAYQDLEMIWTRPDGTERIILSSGKPVFDEQGRFQGYRGASRDVTESREIARELSYQTNYDLVTGLFNRRRFEQGLRELLRDARINQAQHALCYLDLDQFKIINDTCGHAAGDEMLRQLAALLRQQIRSQDMAARLGGDEFGILLKDCKLKQAADIANGLRATVERCAFVWLGWGFYVGASIGLAPIDEHSENPNAVLSAADTACYVAKDAGRNRIHVVHKNDHGTLHRRKEMESVARIRQALEENRFCLYRQSIVPVDPNHSEGAHYELLLRMLGDDGQIVLPGLFLSAAERYHMIGRLDRWVVKSALHWLAERPDELRQLDMCCINLSGQSMGGGETFLRYILRQLDQTEVPPEKICFEITETAAIGNLAQAAEFMGALQQRGCRFALDDFGSGLSSFAYLRNLPVDFLKIDGVFVRDMVADAIDRAMVKSISEIGHVMGKRTIAEFVENEQILGELRLIGVDYAQGYGIGRPEPMIVPPS